MADGMDGLGVAVEVKTRTDDAIDAERALLACVLCDEDGRHCALDRAAVVVAADDFADPRRAQTWRAMLAVKERGEFVDAAAVAEELSARRESLALKHLGDVRSLAVSPAACDQHARRVAEHAYRRRFVAALRDAHAAATGAGTPLDTVSAARAVLAAAPDGVRGERDESIAAGMAAFLEEIEVAARDSAAGQHAVARWGLVALDGGLDRNGGWSEGAIGGMYPGELYVLCGVPASGKTTLAMQATLATAEGDGRAPGRKVLYFSLEMSRASLCRRLAGQKAGVPSARIKRGVFVEGEMDALGVAAQKFGRLPIDVIETARTVEAIRARVLAERARGDVGLVVVDFLQLAQVERRQDDGYREDEDRVYALKHLANAARVPVLAISSMTKAAQRGAAGGKVDSTGTKGAGAEYAADVIAFLVRTDPEDNSGRPEVRFEMTKSRDGTPSAPVLRFDMVRGVFGGASDE